MNQYLKYVLLFNVCACIGCASLNTGSLLEEEEPMTAAELTVAEVATRYLRLCFLADMAALNSYLSKKEYLINQQLDESSYQKEVRALARHWSFESHPVLNLTLTVSDVDEDLAHVEFQREPSQGLFPKVEMDLQWSGSSWGVIDDNIFGAQGLMRATEAK